MKTHKIVLFVLLGVFISCSQYETITEKDEDSTAYAVFQVNKKSGLKSGLYTRYYSSGNKEEEAMYKDGQMHGKRMLYFDAPNDPVYAIEHHVDGMYHGMYKSYYEDGTLDFEGRYEQNTMEGLWKKFYPNGQLQEEVTFSNNEENGPFTEYYKTGHKKAEGNYIYWMDEAREHGLLMLYDSMGVLERKMQCDSGICRTIWPEKKTDLIIEN